jgi:hypothetical protein
MTLAQLALASARAEHSQDPVSDRYKVAAAYCLLGDIQKRAGDLTAAQNSWAAGLAVLPKNVAERPIEMNARLELLQRLGRAAEAGPLAARLKAIGFRVAKT